MTYTREQVEAITTADVEGAKKRSLEARRSRSGVSTWDWTLSQVNGTSHTLEMAKSDLLRKLKP